MTILAPHMARVFLGLAVGFAPVMSMAAPPSTPVDFRHEVYSDSAAELFWTRNTDIPVQGYEVTRNGKTLGVFDALSYFDDTLTPGIAYTYTLAAVGITGERSETSVVTLRTPRSADDIATLQNEINALEAEVQELESQLLAGYRSPVPRTGVSTSLQLGDDGDFQAGVPSPDPRFTVNVNAANDLNEDGVCNAGEPCNGTVTDNLTGLIWLQNANCFGPGTWLAALDAANNLADDSTSICGLADKSSAGDWRLPNVKEIQSLLDYGHSFPTTLLPTGHPFTDVQLIGTQESPAEYWTSTPTDQSDGGAYSVSVSAGWISRLATNGNFANFVWPVKGGL